MESSAVLAKTAKGAEEIKTRAHGLPQKLRSLLILIDGTATAGDLLAKFGSLPEIGAALDALVKQGFAELRVAKPGAAAPPPAAPGAAGPPTQPQNRGQALSVLTRYLIDNLGPDADGLAAALEGAKTATDFFAAAERCAEMLAGIRSQQKAVTFRERARFYAQQFLGA